jgi:hypothetical protein
MTDNFQFILVLISPISKSMHDNKKTKILPVVPMSKDLKI